jgi:type IV pilus assembly protein PilA
VNRQTGYSLIELLIVVSVILIIAAIAVPNFLRARLAANEASAVSSCRTVNTAEFTYMAFYQKGYSSTLAQLGPPSSGPATSAAADLIDVGLAAGQRSGYLFTYTPSALSDTGYTRYAFQANPAIPNNTGTRYFFTDPSGVIRQNVGGPAGPSDSAVH